VIQTPVVIAAAPILCFFQHWHARIGSSHQLGQWRRSSVSDQNSAGARFQFPPASAAASIDRLQAAGLFSRTNPRTAQPAARQGKLFHKLNSESTLNGLIPC